MTKTIPESICVRKVFSKGHNIIIQLIPTLLEEQSVFVAPCSLQIGNAIVQGEQVIEAETIEEAFVLLPSAIESFKRTIMLQSTRIIPPGQNNMPPRF